MTTIHSDGLSLQGVVDETAEFLGTFSNCLTIDKRNLLPGDVLVLGDESQMYDICSYLYQSMFLASQAGVWKFVFFMHEVCRLKDKLYIPDVQEKEKYVAFSLLAKNNDDTTIDLFLRTSARYLGTKEAHDGGGVGIFPATDSVNFCKEGMVVNSEFGLVFTVYLPRRVS